MPGEDKAPYLTAHGYLFCPEQTLRSPQQLDQLVSALLGLRREMSHPYDEPPPRPVPEDMLQLIQAGLNDPAVAHFAARYAQGDLDELKMWKGLALVQSAQVSSLRRSLVDAVSQQPPPSFKVTIGHESLILARTYGPTPSKEG